jgi:hypothetical protein
MRDESQRDRYEQGLRKGVVGVRVVVERGGS